MVQLYTGSGAGKTTAALGSVLRAKGAGKEAAVVFFDKGGTFYSERKALDKLGIVWFAVGLARFNPKTGTFRQTILPEDKKEAERGLNLARQLISGRKYDLIVLDEISVLAARNILPKNEVIELLDQCSKDLELILTGSEAPKEFIARADLVTEMKMIKHPFNKGAKPRRGFEY